MPLLKIFTTSRKRSYGASFTILFLSLLLALSLGPNGLLSLEDFNNPTFKLIFYQVRLPRALVALFCGGSLALAGVLSQGLFRNPLAGPSILGTVSGANLFVVIMLFFGLAKEHWLLQPLSAFLGAILSTGLVWRLSSRSLGQSGGQLLLLGFAINAIFAALATFILSLSLSEYNLSQSILFWLMGSFNGKSWPHVAMVLPWFLGALWASRPLARRLNVLNLGEDLAQSLSVSIFTLRWQTIVLMALLVGSSVAVAGGISFVGLMVPHFTRLYAGADNRHLTTLSCLNGMSIVVLADTLARTMLAPAEIQVGAILSLVGAPVFVFLLLKKGGMRGE